MREKKVDVAFFTNAFWVRAQRKGGIREVFKQNYGMGRTQFVMRVGRREFLEKHRSVMIDYAEDYLTALRYFLDPKNREEAIKLESKFYKIPERVFKRWFLIPKMSFYRDPNGLIDPHALQTNFDLLYKMKFTKKPLKVSDYWDSSYLDAAMKRIGRR